MKAIFGSTRRKAAAVGVSLAIAAIAVGCGGSGAGGAGSTSTNAANGSTTTNQEQKFNVRLLGSSTVLATSKTAPVDLTAIVTDLSGVAVSNKTVTFAANDALNGVLVQVVTAATDASGVATARLSLVGDVTPRNVKVLASVEGNTPAELQVAVSDQAGTANTGNSARGELSIRLGTDDKIESLDAQLSYLKKYVAIVSDNAGNPKPNATVLATLRPQKYYIGYWYSPAASTWARWVLSVGGVDSEDTSNFGFCDAGEDVNGDRLLTPGNVASITVTGQTDANGLAVMNVVYPKSFAGWVDYEVEVTARVGGTEGVNAFPIPLLMLADDADNNTPPPAVIRTRSSLSTTAAPYPLDPLEPATSLQSQFASSPFPYFNTTPSCP